LQAKANGGALLPAGVALNINFPKFDAGASTALPWAFARHGSYDYLTLKFVSDLSRDPVAKSFGLGSYAYPGMTFNFTTAPATATQAEDEAALNAAGKVAVTAMQVGYEARTATQQWLRLRLRSLFTQ